MTKEYSVQGTTNLQREKMVHVAIALSILGAPEPSEMAMELLREVIDDTCELAEVRKRILDYYKAKPSHG